MHEVKVLEQRWRQYNRKRRYPLYLLLGISIVTLAVLYLKRDAYFPLLRSQTMQKNVLSSVTHNVLIQPSTFVLNGTIDSLDFEKKQEEVVDNHHILSSKLALSEAPVLPVEDIPLLDNLKNTVRSVVKKKRDNKSEIGSEHQKPYKKIKLKIIESTNIQAYKDVEHRFYKTHDPVDALFLAKAYFKMGKFNNAAYWALEANKINSNIEESWILFAQSKAKLRHINEAIRILESYLKRENSLKAKKLLKKLKSKE